MNAHILDGKALAQSLRQRIQAQVAVWRAEGRRAPGLAVILVGNDPASEVYVRNSAPPAKPADLESHHHHLPATTSQVDLLALGRAAPPR